MAKATKKALKKKAKKIPRKTASSRSVDSADLLVELGTEELPPKALKRLSQSLGQSFVTGLEEAGLVETGSACQIYAAPRRLAVLVPKIKRRQPDREQIRRGPAVQAAFDAAGKPTKAAEGFAASCGVKVGALETLKTDKGEWLVSRQMEQGRVASAIIPEVFDAALRQLPIPKRMRWGDLDAEFVRPVHWLLMLHGDKPVRAELLAVKAGNQTKGHRFHAPKPIVIKKPADYARVLKSSGKVIASFDERRELICKAVEKLATKAGGQALIEDALLDEVASLVEWPEPVLGNFDKAFLDVPAEALISAMQDHQKYFPVTSKQGKLLPHFITVSNIKSKKKAEVIAGNERVLRARFSDAAFFWNTDRKTPLVDRVDQLKSVVFHKKLGSIHDKSMRTARLAAHIANALEGSAQNAERAAVLAKADLLSGMVGEFPELQGTMGRYYADYDGEDESVALAIEEQYLPRFAGDRLPQSNTGQALSIADKLDSLAGIFAIGQLPTGDKDPFGLRRAALGVLRILIESKLDVDLNDLISVALSGFATIDVPQDTASKLYEFMMDRLRAYYQDSGIRTDVIESVRARTPARPLDYDRRVRAVMAFLKLKESASLAAANKRIRNILKQSGQMDWDHVSRELLLDPAEIALAQVVEAARASIEPHFETGNYTQAMKALAALRPEVDRFFDKVMVMVEEEAVRDNRLALLSALETLFLRVADLSVLQEASK